MKKTIGLLICLFFILVLCSCTSSKIADGTYTGKAKGVGDIEVTLTIKDGVIVDCKAVGDNESQGIGSEVIDTFPNLVVEKNSVEIDAKTGATITSKAFVEAARQALKEAEK